MKDRMMVLLDECIKKDDMHAFYISNEWKKKRLRIMERDHYECQKCRGRGKIKILKPNSSRRDQRAYVHHIRHLKDYPELALTDSNLVTLCFSCHEEEHIDERNLFRKNKEGFTNEEKW